MKYLKTFRFIFNIILVLSVFFIVGFSLFKILYRQKNYAQDKDKKNTIYRKVLTHWDKNNFIVPTDNILLNDVDTVIGEYYYLEQSVETNNYPEKCYMGILKLQSIKKDRYVFSSPTILDKSNLLKYSNFNSYKLTILPLNKEQYSKEKHVINCQNWVKLINKECHNQENTKQNTAILKTNSKNDFNIPLNKCLAIPRKKYLTIESENSDSLYLEYDEIYNRVNLCAKSPGSSLITFQPVDGSGKFSIRSQSLQNNKITKNNHKPNKNIYKKFLTHKVFPGWQ